MTPPLRAGSLGQSHPSFVERTAGGEVVHVGDTVSLIIVSVGNGRVIPVKIVPFHGRHKDYLLKTKPNGNTNLM